MAKPTFYAPENNEAKKITRLIAPVDGNGSYIGKLYGSVDGKTRLVGRFRHTKPAPPQNLQAI